MFNLRSSIKLIITFIVIGIALYLLFYGINASISRSDESIHATVAREIAFGSSPWWRPTFFGSLYLNKPPLQLWGTSALLHIFEDYNFVYRIIPGLAGLGTLLILYFWIRGFFGGYSAALAAVLFALSGNHVLFDHGMRVATQDSTLLFFTLLGTYLYFKFLFSKELENSKYLYLASLSVGAAFLTKWIAGALPLIIFGIFLVLTKDGRDILKRDFKKIFLSSLIAVAIPGCYLLPHLIFEFDASIAALTWNLTERLIGKGFHNQDEWTLYLTHLFWKGSYGEPLLVLLSIIYGFYNVRDSKFKFLIIWFLVPLIGYSILSSRLAWYFLPAAGSFWILFGAAFDSLKKSSINSPSIIKSSLVIAVVSILAFGIYQQANRLHSRQSIELDYFVEEFRDADYSVDFSRIDLTKDGANGLTRRQIFYLNRLMSNSKENSDRIILLIPFAEFNAIKEYSELPHMCLNSENKKTKTLACLVLIKNF